ncbi:MAG TPA: polyprenol monophosphomannose synthase [Candidatus Latescibacteria bacterium]|nr:polyprenol monophosphomannose synthase [Candidatus Latescibacterota bacterium]
MKILVIIPTYNERENIEELINKILELRLNLEILVVDDNSPDGTGEIVNDLSVTNPRIHLLRRQKKMGLGSAYVDGFKYALQNGYELIFEMDADLSHNPEYIPLFLEKITDHDLVVGSRYISGVNVVNWPLKRLLLSYYANVYARVVTGLPIRDATGGFKCFRREVLQSIDLDRVSSNGYSFQIEMTFLAWKKRFRICEIPIIFYDRRRGTSKLSLKVAGEAIWMVWKLRLMSLLKMV